jgi:hypothetical protein
MAVDLALGSLGIAVCFALTRQSGTFTDFETHPATPAHAACSTVFHRWADDTGIQTSSSDPNVQASYFSANTVCSAALDKQQEWVVALSAVALVLFTSSFLVRRSQTGVAPEPPSETTPGP